MGAPSFSGSAGAAWTTALRRVPFTGPRPAMASSLRAGGRRTAELRPPMGHSSGKMDTPEGALWWVRWVCGKALGWARWSRGGGECVGGLPEVEKAERRRLGGAGTESLGAAGSLAASCLLGGVVEGELGLGQRDGWSAAGQADTIAVPGSVSIALPVS